MTVAVAVYTDASGKVGTTTVYAGDDYTEFGTPEHPSGTGCPDVTVDGAAVTGTFCVSPDTSAGYVYPNKATSGGGPDGILYPGATVHLHYPSTPTGPQNVDLVYWPPLDIGPDPIDGFPAPTYLPDGYTGVPYGFALTADGGQPTPPVYTFTVVSGTLPPGLVVTSAGVIQGTPTGAIGDYNFSVQLSDAGGSAPVPGYFLLTVRAAHSALDLGPHPTDPLPAPAILPNGELGSPYSFPLTASGGSGYFFFRWCGPLPPGVNINGSTGLIGGSIPASPSAAGVYVFTVRLTDASPKVPAFGTFQITIGAPPPPSGPLVPSSGPGGGGTLIVITGAA